MDDTRIHPTAEVEPGAQIGSGTTIWHLCHVRAGAQIGRNCSLGRNVYVDSGVIIGNGVRIQNNVSIYNGVTIDDDVFIGPHVTFTNDRRPRAFPTTPPWEIMHTRVMTGASIGAGAVVICGHNIGTYAMIGAGAVVCREVETSELVIGYSKHAGYVSRNGDAI